MATKITIYFLISYPILCPRDSKNLSIRVLFSPEVVLATFYPILAQIG